MKPTFEDMLMLYKQWKEFPRCPVEEFFNIYHWTQATFFDECYRRGVII